jgi:hypothetical protein
MLTIEHEHIVHLIMLTMISFNSIALNGFLSKKFNILQGADDKLGQFLDQGI